jgi:hypothetical protein
LAFVVAAGLAISMLRAEAPKRRARPPKFDKSIEDAFFPDAREKLVGPRPAPAKSPAAAAPGNPKSPTAPPAPSGPGWSRLVSAEVVEDEIKSQQRQLADAVKNPGRFKGGGYQEARGELSVLAALFAIAAEYDGSIRWQREAAAARDALARAGFNCKAGSDATYNEAKARAEDLETLVRGGSVQFPPASDNTVWPKVADRAPLMKRLEQAQQQSVAPLSANKGEFERHADRLAHEAQLIAALAEVIAREGYEFADDETYREHARAMQTEALRVRDAALSKNYEQARQAAGTLGKACTNCHEGYRS